MRRSCLSLLVFAFLAIFAGSAAAQNFSLDNNSLGFSTGAGTSPPSQAITLTNNTGGALKISLSAKTQSGGSWLRATISPNPVPSGAQATITVAPFTTNLAVNDYTGTLSVTDGATKANVKVSLSVEGVTISAPTSKSINLVQGASGSLSIHVTGGPAALVVATNVSWLNTAGSGQAPGDISVGVDASSLAPGQYSGGVSLQCASGGSPCLPVFVFVTCNVTASASLKVNVASLSFQASQGRLDPLDQGFQITTTDGSSITVSIVPDSIWLKAIGTSSVASSKPIVVTVSVSASLLKPGANMGNITLGPSNGAAPVVIPVTATLAPFSISITPASPLAVNVASGKTQTVPLQAATADDAPATLAVTAHTSDNRAWLTAPATVTAPAGFNVTVDASQLAPGNYSGTLTFACSDTTCPAVQETLNVTVGAGTLAPQLNAVVGAGLSVPPVNSLAANGLFTIFGTGFADPSVNQNVSGSDLTNNTLPSNLANTCVQGGNVRWGLIYVSAAQINAVANPLSTSGSIAVSVIRNCGQTGEVASAPLTVDVAAQTPQFLFVVQNPNGKNEVVALEALTGAKVGPTGLIPGQNFTPAKAGDILTAYGVGWGATTPAAVVGSLAAAAADITGDHKLTIGGKTAQVSYAGLAPTFAGLYQINFIVPSGLTAGNQPMVLTIDGVPTPAGAFLAVK